MNQAFAVIGAGYGDEGKGLTTDFLVRKLSIKNRIPIVARGNGGAQAGHTVVTESKRHVFGHIGAGTFAGAPTYLSSNFIINPYTLLKEAAALDVNVQDIVAHPDCRVTTIFDMALNGLRELSRGNNRHGSCGLGINETVTRHLADFTLTAEQVVDSMDFERVPLSTIMLDIFRRWWLPRFQELDTLELRQLPEAAPLMSIFNDPDFSFHAAAVAKGVVGLSIANTSELQDWRRRSGVPLIIEGAQGLALDEFLGEFPHVTRSITGLPSAIVAAAELGYREINPLYVTRCYTTRHGAGPLKNEGIKFTNSQIIDSTNVTGQWQGELRFAPIDLAQLERLVKEDLERSKMVAQLLNVNVGKPKLMVTCLDQVGSLLAYTYVGDTLHWVSPEDFISKVSELTHLDVAFCSYGRTAKDIIERS